MTETPMLMSAPMVRSLRAYLKTMTRREIKHPEFVAFLDKMESIIRKADLKDYLRRFAEDDHFKCGYGQPGDLLWIRETWQPWGYAYADEPEFLINTLLMAALCRMC